MDRLLGEWGILMDNTAGREQFAFRMEARRKNEETGQSEPPAWGWCLGSEEFRQELLQQMTVLPPHPYAGPEWKETSAKKAERILAEELNKLAGV